MLTPHNHDNQCTFELLRDIAGLLVSMEAGTEITLRIQRHTPDANPELLSTQSSHAMRCGPAKIANAMKEAYYSDPFEDEVRLGASVEAFTEAEEDAYPYGALTKEMPQGVELDAGGIVAPFKGGYLWAFKLCDTRNAFLNTHGGVRCRSNGEPIKYVPEVDPRAKD